MNPWTVVIHAQAEAELLSLPPDMRARFLRIAAMLEEFGPGRIGLPLVRLLTSKWWEMRMQGRDGVARAVYVAVQDRRLVVLHVFIKKTQRTPSNAISIALKRWSGVQ